MKEFILKKDNIYIAICDDNLSEESQKKLSQDPMTLIAKTSLSRYNKENSTLYGGRVKVSLDVYKWHISVCGIEIDTFYYNGYGAQQIADFLNQIEQLGIDAFLSNYKSKVEEHRLLLKQEEQDLMNKISTHEDEDLLKRLSFIRGLLESMLTIIFFLSLHVPTGLDNAQYEEAYQSIIYTINNPN